MGLSLSRVTLLPKKANGGGGRFRFGLSLSCRVIDEIQVPPPSRMQFPSFLLPSRKKKKKPQLSGAEISLALAEGVFKINTRVRVTPRTEKKEKKWFEVSSLQTERDISPRVVVFASGERASCCHWPLGSSLARDIPITRHREGILKFDAGGDLLRSSSKSLAGEVANVDTLRGTAGRKKKLGSAGG